MKRQENNLALLKILPYGDPILRKRSVDVDEIDEDLRHLVDDMIETMEAAVGLGLAAPQVGISKRFFVINWTELEDDDEEPQTQDLVVYINPAITKADGEIESDAEGCLSLPKMSAKVTRPSEIVITYQNLDGEEVREELSGYPARAVQHEYDHLQGILFIDRISKEERAKLKGQLQDILSGRIVPFDGTLPREDSDREDESTKPANVKEES